MSNDVWGKMTFYCKHFRRKPFVLKNHVVCVVGHTLHIITKSEAETKHQDKMFLKPFFTKGHPVHIFNHYTNRTQHQHYQCSPRRQQYLPVPIRRYTRIAEKKLVLPYLPVCSRLFSEMQFLTRYWNVPMTLNISLKIHPLELTGYSLKRVA